MTKELAQKQRAIRTFLIGIVVLLALVCTGVPSRLGLTPKSELDYLKEYSAKVLQSNLKYELVSAHLIEHGYTCTYNKSSLDVTCIKPMARIWSADYVFVARYSTNGKVKETLAYTTQATF